MSEIDKKLSETYVCPVCGCKHFRVILTPSNFHWGNGYLQCVDCDMNVLPRLIKVEWFEGARPGHENKDRTNEAIAEYYRKQGAENAR